MDALYCSNKHVTFKLIHIWIYIYSIIHVQKALSELYPQIDNVPHSTIKDTQQSIVFKEI